MADAEQQATNYGVFGVGNSLLDVSAEVGKEVLDQYDLKPGKFNFFSPNRSLSQNSFFFHVA